MTNTNLISIGCDLHDKTLVNQIAINREVSQQRIVSNTRGGRSRLIAMLGEKARTLGGARIVLVYEASAQGFILHDELRAAGIECYVLAPTKIERSNKHKRNKNDKSDAERLVDIIGGHVLAGTPLPAVWVPDPQTRDDRETVRTRQDLGEKASGIKLQIQTLVKRHGVEKPSEIGNSRTKSYRQWVVELSKSDQRGVGFRTALESLLRQLEFSEQEIHRLDEAVDKLSEMPHLKPIVEEIGRAHV